MISRAPNHNDSNISTVFGLNSSIVRTVNFFLGALYATCLNKTYIILSEKWSYMGYWYVGPNMSTTVFIIIAASSLFTLLPVGNWSILNFTKWVICLTLFVPALVIPPQQGLINGADEFKLEFLIYSSAILFIIGLSEGESFRKIKINKQTLNTLIFLIWALSNVAIFVVFRRSLNIVAIDDVYFQRSSASNLAGGGIVYVLGIVSGGINPYLIISGIKDRRILFIFMAICSQLLIYATLAQKVVIASLIIAVFIYYIFVDDKISYKRVYLGITMISIIGPIVSRIQTISSDGISSIISDLLYLRVITLPGVSTGLYLDFFSTNPVTYFSHSLIGRIFSNYPYGNLSIGQVIGHYLFPESGESVINFNANFIAADGITGFGPFGIPLIVFISMAIFWIMAKLVGDEERALTCSVLSPFIISLSDSSIFTALLTGGGGVAMILLYLRRGRTRI
jgi:hypothetical protein